MTVLIAYLSYSGNTKEVAELIQQQVESNGIAVEMHRIGIEQPIKAEKYQFIFLGTFTWDKGKTPDEVKDFVWEVGYKPSNIAIFGTGETQFGGDALFCKAVDKLVTFYGSRWDGLKIEQSPRGSQEQLVENWVERVLHDVNTYT
ncbi:flavodoxin [Oceanobacillus halotolerans]|uniref:flavodoxin n=1 Tax=Oceanobacillus halotolerans TaxID=2663380 RepID=UPI0013DCE8B4|nr:flavodoxin [Oceanobacillus halotolerans]